MVVTFQTHFPLEVLRFRRFKSFARRYADLRSNEPSLEKAQTRVSCILGSLAIRVALLWSRILLGIVKEIQISRSPLELRTSPTVSFSSLTVREPTIWCRNAPDVSHKSLQNRNYLPFFTFHFNPLLKIPPPPSLQVAQTQEQGL